MAKAKIFAVNILREDQQAIARQFATPHPDKFRDNPMVFGELGVPLLSAMLATIECRVAGEVTGGTHAVFLAEVQATHAEEGMSLAYFRGRMGKFVFSPAEGKAPLWRDVLRWEDYYSSRQYLRMERGTDSCNSSVIAGKITRMKVGAPVWKTRVA